MKKYIISFKDFIPTWIICIFMFFGVYGWTFAIGFVLLVIQYLQRRKQKKDNKNTDNSELYIKEIERLNVLLQENDDDVEKKDAVITYKDREIEIFSYLSNK